MQNSLLQILQEGGLASPRNKIWYVSLLILLYLTDNFIYCVFSAAAETKIANVGEETGIP